MLYQVRLSMAHGVSQRAVRPRAPALRRLAVLCTPAVQDAGSLEEGVVIAGHVRRVLER